MTLQLCRLAPTAGSLEVRQGFVSYHRISTYSVYIISPVSDFVKGVNRIFRAVVFSAAALIFL